MASSARLTRIEERLALLEIKTEERLTLLEVELARLQAALEPHGAAPAQLPRVEGIEVGASPTLGPEEAPVTIVEFADFECPFCASAARTLEAVLASYPGQVRRVFKHNPMPFHKQAVLAHKAALAAAEAGKFWAMHRLLYAEEGRLDRESLRGHARALGLDLDLFDARLSSAEGLKAIQADRELSRKLGVLGVPAFFINGRFVAGAQPFEVFRQVIDEELGERKAVP